MATCQYCGKEFIPSKYAGGRQRFCSKKCKDKWDYENPKYTPVVCKHCGKKFIPKEINRTTYCSRECAFADKAKKCKVCGKVITGSRSDYCSDECKANATHHEIKCIVCGKVFIGRTGARYCSDECRKEKSRQDARKYAETKHKLANKQVKCKHCGREFEPEYGTKRRQFCSDFCQIKHQKRQRRARKRRQYAEEVSLAYIYERDGGRCQICGKKVNLKYQVPHPLAATLDHIIPLANGGLHEKKNIQLAHFICNCRKSNKGYGQLKLFG